MIKANGKLVFQGLKPKHPLIRHQLAKLSLGETSGLEQGSLWGRTTQKRTLPHLGIVAGVRACPQVSPIHHDDSNLFWHLVAACWHVAF